MHIFRPQRVVAGFHADILGDECPDLSHCGEQWFGAGEEIGRHHHSVWEIYLQLTGPPTGWWSDDGRFEISSGEAFLAAPQRRHALDRPADGRLHFLFLGMDLATVAQRLGLAGPIQRCHRIADARPLEAPLRLLLAEVATPAPHRKDFLRAGLDCLAIALVRTLSGAAADPALPMHPAVAAAQARMEARLDQAWTVVELAAGSGVSPGHLNALFQRHAGEPPRRWLLHRRIARAQTLLSESDLPVTDIALELGFASSQHFAHAFRRIAGCSARTWRSRGSVQQPDRGQAGGQEDAVESE
ncbi:hypothetical protein LBMAG53_29000 [Planctomycetota bacterium]|nr:hypothetical protein LBMAG53_29000 [Planctomycetota bacterium]